MEAGNAVKGLIVKDDKILLVKRTPDEDQSPNAWEIPGGRLDVGEEPRKGLAREIKEETDLDVEVLHPLNTQHFIRACGMTVTMIIYLCKPLSEKITLEPKELVAYEWIDIDKAKEKLIHFFHGEIDIYNQFFRKNINFK